MRFAISTFTTLALILSISGIAAAQSTLYWVDSNAWKIQSMDLSNGTTNDILTATLRSPDDIAIDLDGGKMYWISQPNGQTGFVRRANLDGSEIEDLPGTETHWPGDLVLDADAGWLYWSGDDAIQRVKLDGSSRGVVRDSANAQGLALDLNGGKIYWTSSDGALNGTIYRADLDGSDAELVQETYPQQPGELALDASNGKVYWTFNGLLIQADLDGSNRKVVPLGAAHEGAYRLTIDSKHGFIYVNAYGWEDGRRFVRVYQHNLTDGTTTTLPIDDNLYPTRIEAAGNQLYWTDYFSGRIQRLNLDNHEVVELIRSPVRKPHNVSVDPEDRKVYWTESHTLKRANFDGTGIEILVRPVQGSFPDPITTDLALDLTNRKMYWTMWSGWGPGHDGGVFRSNLDGSNIDSLYQRGVSAIALDPEAGKMYFAVTHSEEDHGLRQANLDGSDLIEFDNSLTDFEHRVGDPISLDLKAGLIFWIRDEGIWRAKIDGSNPELHIPRSNVSSLSVDSHESKLYWTETDSKDGVESGSRIVRANLDGSDVEDILVSEEAMYRDVFVNSESSNATAVIHEQPAVFALLAAYPNPFNPSTTIHFSLATTEPVSIKVRDGLGRMIAVLVDDVRPVGTHTVTWNADKDTPSGVYFYTLETASGAVTRSMLLLK